VYDREYRFFEADFAALQRAGYCTIAVPQALGGLVLSPAEVDREQRRLACDSHAASLAPNMHRLRTTAPRALSGVEHAFVRRRRS
jgi:alkylation response protein AidB-like acyl-CoA dehydrogenase